MEEEKVQHASWRAYAAGCRCGGGTSREGATGPATHEAVGATASTSTAPTATSTAFPATASSTLTPSRVAAGDLRTRLDRLTETTPRTEDLYIEEEDSTPVPAGRRRGASDPNKERLQKLANCNKVVKIKLGEENDIILFLDTAARLQSAIEDLYSGETEKFRIMIALACMEPKIRGEAESIYETARLSDIYNLSEFFQNLFKLIFPAPNSTLEIGFRTLTQNNPKGSITDYARRFRMICKLLNFSLMTHINKFIEGLASGEVKAALRRTNLEGMEFGAVVTLAVGITNNLSFEKSNMSKIFAGREREGSSGGYGDSLSTGERIFGRSAPNFGDEEEEDDKINKIMGVAFSTYKKASEKLGVSGCYNCFQKHRAFDCPLKSCKFCKQPTSKVQHFSIICPNCPSKLDMYHKQRNDWKEKREQDKVKALWEENRVFDFGSEDESD